MAKLSAHGVEIGRIEYLTNAKAYMSDGKILKNYGQGWKVYGRCKPGITPEQAFSNAAERQRNFHDVRPDFCAYRAMLRNLAGLSKRWKLHTAIQMMPDDPDGVWSEACDGYGDNISADLDDIVKACELYKAAMREQDELKDPTNALAAA